MLLQQDFFEKTVEQFPDNIAVDDHGDQITYLGLDGNSNQLAHLLKKLGCAANDRVCIFTEKSIKAYTAILATLKAGGCWVPLNKAFPTERIKFLFQTLKPCAVICDSASVKITEALKRELKAEWDIVYIDEQDIDDPDDSTLSIKDYINLPAERPSRAEINNNDLAYIIFTSGSTGEPKGVMVRHSNTVLFLSECQKFFQVQPKSRFAHFSDLTFDPSVFDMFYCWASAGTLVPMNKREYKINPSLFLLSQNINVLFTVPSVILQLQNQGKLSDQALKTLKHLLLTGEAVPAPLLCAWYDEHPDSQVYNMYGTTETAIISHWYKVPSYIKAGDEVAVGYPMPTIRVMLMDDGKIVENGQIGESVICGGQLSPGYWANDQQTDTVFSSYPDHPDLPIRVYKTGDLLRKDENDLYYYVGRRDNQVKVRGNRVELGEVERHIINFEGVQNACVVPIGESHEKRLYAYVHCDEMVTKKQLKRHLIQSIPAFMIPSHFHLQNKSLPLNANGKIDRKELIAQVTET
ncbi:amino acid adenylation domain-containing protein [Terasakiella sp. SH-1]|uniref:amino acid adenylation domain-containing protein n=1 Tax=Terasakiella sp. SH-1 TaxID=2560057 RepID=UPI00107346BC|nr:amino acid adenylation domain-containing protein [Terasakiella sp. SH-1]